MNIIYVLTSTTVTADDGLRLQSYLTYKYYCIFYLSFGHY